MDWCFLSKESLDLINLVYDTLFVTYLIEQIKKDSQMFPCDTVSKNITKVINLELTIGKIWKIYFNMTARNGNLLGQSLGKFVVGYPAKVVISTNVLGFDLNYVLENYVCQAKVAQ